MNIVKVKSVESKIKRVRQLMESVKNQIGVVHFIKRSDGKRRRMSYRLHVYKPTYSKAPTGKGTKKAKKVNTEKNLMTVFDTNTILYKDGRMVGRGAYRSVPLDSVIRVAVGGEIYKFVS